MLKLVIFILFFAPLARASDGVDQALREVEAARNRYNQALKALPGPASAGQIDKLKKEILDPAEVSYRKAMIDDARRQQEELRQELERTSREADAKLKRSGKGDSAPSSEGKGSKRKSPARRNEKSASHTESKPVVLDGSQIKREIIFQKKSAAGRSKPEALDGTGIKPEIIFQKKSGSESDSP